MYNVGDIVYCFISGRVFQARVVSVTQKISAGDVKAVSYGIEYKDCNGKMKTSSRSADEIHPSFDAVIDMILHERYFKLNGGEK